MVTKVLVDRDIEAGKHLVLQIDRLQIPLSAAMWLYREEDDRYQLVLASDKYDSDPLDAYRAVHEALKKLSPGEGPAFEDIKVVSPSDPIIHAIHTAVKTGTEVAGIRFSRNTVNGTFIEDAWIYRSV